MEPLKRIGMILTMSVLPSLGWAGDILKCTQGTQAVFTDSRFTCPLASAQPVGVKPQTVRLERRVLDHIPDLNQYQSDDVFPANGKKFCAPVAVSNSLSAARGGLESQEQIELAKLLGSSEYMSTGDKGTSPRQVLDGVARFLKSETPNAELSYHGNRKVPGRYNPERISDVSPQWLMSGIAKDDHIWLNIGWYQRLSNGELKRTGGHWVTLVGYERFGSGKDGIKDALLIHDPATRSERLETVAYQPLAVQKIAHKNGRVERADHLLELTQGLNKPKSADLALLDGAVRLAL